MRLAMDSTMQTCMGEKVPAPFDWRGWPHGSPKGAEPHPLESENGLLYGHSAYIIMMDPVISWNFLIPRELLCELKRFITSYSRNPRQRSTERLEYAYV